MARRTFFRQSIGMIYGKVCGDGYYWAKTSLKDHDD